MLWSYSNGICSKHPPLQLKELYHKKLCMCKNLHKLAQANCISRIKMCPRISNNCSRVCPEFIDSLMCRHDPTVCLSTIWYMFFPHSYTFAVVIAVVLAVVVIVALSSWSRSSLLLLLLLGLFLLLLVVAVCLLLNRILREDFQVCKLFRFDGWRSNTT